MAATDMLHGRNGALPSIASVSVGNSPYAVIIEWAEGSRAGTREVIDLAPMILTYKVFKPLRDDARLFATVRPSEYRDAIEWGEDDSLAMSGETLERLAEEVMTSEQFTEFMKRNKLTLDGTAAQLGISRRMAAYYSKDRTVPRYIALACKFIENERSQNSVRLNNQKLDSISSNNGVVGIGETVLIGTGGQYRFYGESSCCSTEASAPRYIYPFLSEDGGFHMKLSVDSIKDRKK